MSGMRLTDAQVARALRAHLPDRAHGDLRDRILEVGGGDPTAADTALVPRGSRRRGPGQPPAEPAHRCSPSDRCGARECRGSRCVASHPARPHPGPEPRATGRPVCVRRLELRSVARAAAACLDVAGQRRRPRAASTSIGREPSDSIGSRQPRRRSPPATPCSATTASAAWRPSGPTRSGSNPEARRSERTRGSSSRPSSVPKGRNARCEPDPSEVGNGATASGWRYVGVEDVAGRPTHHVACVGDVWIDIETRLILRVREPRLDDADQPIPGQYDSTEVTEIEFGEQPTALFDAPEGVAHMTSDAYSAYLCTRDVQTEVEVGFGTRECAQPEQAEPLPDAQPDAHRASDPERL